jgi:hypothetical protein
MNAVFTLNIDQNVVENAEIYAKRAQRTVSQLIEEYLLSIPAINEIAEKPMGTITKRLTGIIKLDKNVSDKELLTDALTEKYL